LSGRDKKWTNSWIYQSGLRGQAEEVNLKVINTQVVFKDVLALLPGCNEISSLLHHMLLLP
jgi:hypothetical protein